MEPNKSFFSIYSLECGKRKKKWILISYLTCKSVLILIDITRQRLLSETLRLHNRFIIIHRAQYSLYFSKRITVFLRQNVYFDVFTVVYRHDRTHERLIQYFVSLPVSTLRTGHFLYLINYVYILCHVRTVNRRYKCTYVNLFRNRIYFFYTLENTKCSI